MTSIVLVEDESLVRAGLRELIDGESDLEVVGEACDGRDALEIIARTTPDVVVMDVRMPGIDGTEVARRVVTNSHPPAVLLLTTFGTQAALIDGMRAGARGFLLKSATPEQFVEAIRTVARGDTIVSPKLTAGLVQQALGRPPESPGAAPELARLSDRERDVLMLVTRGQSNAEIAKALDVALPTVKSHVRHILAKLGLRNRLQAVIAAQDAGLASSASDIESGE